MLCCEAMLLALIAVRDKGHSLIIFILWGRFFLSWYEWSHEDDGTDGFIFNSGQSFCNLVIIHLCLTHTITTHPTLSGSDPVAKKWKACGFICISLVRAQRGDI